MMNMLMPADPFRELDALTAAYQADIANAYHHLVHERYRNCCRPAAYAAAADIAPILIIAADTIVEDPQRHRRCERQHPEPGPPSQDHPSGGQTWIGRRPPEKASESPRRLARRPSRRREGQSCAGRPSRADPDSSSRKKP